MRQELLDAINQTADYLNKASRWYTYGQPFGHIDDNNEDDYIYEFYCLLKIAEAVLNSDNITISLDTTGPKGTSFPQKPAEKENGWAKFIITDSKGIKYDLCGGIKVHHTLIKNYTAAPDISFQNSGTTNPNEQDVFMIMDSKFKTANNACFEISELREFSQIIQDLNAYGQNELPFNLIAILGFHNNALITNKSPNGFQRAYSDTNGFVQVGKFTPNSVSEII